MDTLLRIILTLTYPLLLLARLLNGLLGRDPLRLRNPGGDTYWIAREVEPDQAAYFSEASSVEGRGHGGMGFIAAAVLKQLAACFAPRREPAAGSRPTAVERDQGIPDEVYTLW